jgi:hypothetical protein
MGTERQTFSLEIPGYAELLEACATLAEALKTSNPAEPTPVPGGVRPDIHRVAGMLCCPTWEAALRYAAEWQVDPRDLTTREFAYLEQISEATAADMRSKGTGPKYRHESRVLYPLAEVWAWRLKGKQSMVEQRRQRGRRGAL